MRTNRSPQWLWTLPVLLIAFALATFRLSEDIFWLDEEFSIFMSGGAHFGPVSVLEVLVRVGDHAWPPLHNLLLLAWSFFFGWSEFATRSLSLYLGVLSVALIYRCGRDMLGHRTGLIACVALAASAFFSHYMHEGRGYTLYVMLTLLTFVAYWRLLHGPTGRRARGMRWLFLLSMVGLLYTHYIAATTPAALGLYHLFFVRHDRRWSEIFRIFFWALILFVPWMLIAVLAVLAESNVSRGLDAWTVLTSSLYGYGNGLWFFIVAILVYAGIFLRTKAAALTAFWLLSAFVMSLIFNLFSDFLFHVRHIIVILPPLMLLIAFVVHDLSGRQRFLGVGVLAVWVGAGVLAYGSADFMMRLPGQEPSLPRQEMRSAFDTLAACMTGEDLAVFHISEPRDEPLNNRVLRYYLVDQPGYYAQVGTLGDLSFYEKPPLDGSYAERFEILAGQVPGLWWLRMTDLPETEQTLEFAQLMTADFELCAAASSSGAMQIQFYVPKGSASCAARINACSLLGGQSDD